MSMKNEAQSKQPRASEFKKGAGSDFDQLSELIGESSTKSLYTGMFIKADDKPEPQKTSPSAMQNQQSSD